ncbi:MAG: hypothetical protein DMF85_12565 [Acidobacteria bacterium]|nr:MAG: hypothetical protein DMF85_12565 [Acidobacteriota bacterium]
MVFQPHHDRRILDIGRAPHAGITDRRGAGRHPDHPPARREPRTDRGQRRETRHRSGRRTCTAVSGRRHLRADARSDALRAAAARRAHAPARSSRARSGDARRTRPPRRDVDQRRAERSRRGALRARRGRARPGTCRTGDVRARRPDEHLHRRRTLPSGHRDRHRRRQRCILLQVFIEGAVIALAGAAAGILFALASQRLFNGFFQWRYDTTLVFLRITPSVVWRSLAMAVPFGIAASLVASWTFLRQQLLALIRR